MDIEKNYIAVFSGKCMLVWLKDSSMHFTRSTLRQADGDVLTFTGGQAGAAG